MRSFEELVRDYPDKTGKEILAIQNKEDLEQKKKEKAFTQSEFDLIEDINANGGYYISKLVQGVKTLYNVKKLFYDSTECLYCDYESIVIINHDEFSCEIKNYTYRHLFNLKMDSLKRISKEEYELMKYKIMYSLPLFDSIIESNLSVFDKIIRDKQDFAEYIETYSEILTNVDSIRRKFSNIDDILNHHNGRFGAYELCMRWTDEFIEIHGDNDFDGDFIDVVALFTHDKVGEYMEKES